MIGKEPESAESRIGVSRQVFLVETYCVIVFLGSVVIKVSSMSMSRYVRFLLIPRTIRSTGLSRIPRLDADTTKNLDESSE